MTLGFDPLSQLDRFAASVFDSPRAPKRMPVDLYRDGDRYVLHADMPGVDPGSIDVDVDGGQLSIRAQRTMGGQESVRWFTRERESGSFLRQFALGDGVDLDGISASYDNGVLSVIIPVSDRAKPRRIRVESSDQGQRIDA
ncbi:Hsp20/alpha crystallin family protein [Microbacterium azadirachtae]|uniref:Hsp20/alpha crystallin family protein n=1 Tax=Microbacterium azadirachtae TaxID=582680 RepID=UPI00088E434D|nr:Hsp20/alpha crystallin family protein [Microbacterium azadirachtae]UXW85423.1 Hsp20/alpha crystallin family protein [Microbacterium azadirachtae]SDM15105.1 heat shock protein Hsp20 [Microbacterium azadirachtae]SEG38779.1 heat shock protein Hsp20 [Microbacterium azadirachtae]SEG41799.1 heat shock protein Hsp20 [Microbacterium azadirachtae]